MTRFLDIIGTITAYKTYFLSLMIGKHLKIAKSAIIPRLPTL